MTTIGKLVDIVSRALGLPRESVAVHARNLRGSDHIATKGRGRGAARMTTRHAARLLIAAASSPATKDSVETVESFADLRALRVRALRLHPEPLPRNFESFVVDRMEAIVTDRDAGRLNDGYLRTVVDRGPTSAIEFVAALGFETKRFPRRALVRWYPTKAHVEDRATLPTLSFLPEGFLDALGQRLPLAPGLFQERHVSFTAFHDIAVSI